MEVGEASARHTEIQTVSFLASLQGEFCGVASRQTSREMRHDSPYPNQILYSSHQQAAETHF
jgi:hypothetical protein